jgi:Zn-dependent protease
MKRRTDMSRGYAAMIRRGASVASALIHSNTSILLGPSYCRRHCLMRSPILFGYAKPVPVNFQALRNSRLDLILVAAAGPAMNFALAMLAALAFHLVTYLPDAARPWVAENLKNTLIINVLLAIFNLLPLPPLDGGRIAVGVLPDALAVSLARLESYGMMILIGLLFILPLLGAQLGIDLNVVWQLVQRSTNVIIDLILWLTGNT